MRKFYLILLVMAGFIACTNDGLREGAVQEDTPLTQQYDPNRRSFAEGAGNGYFYSNILNANNAIQYDSNYYPLQNGQDYNYYNSVQYFPVWH